MDEVDVCLYHANCKDGYCAFWLVKRAFPDVVGVPVNYGEPLPDESVYAGKRVLIADFSYPPDVLTVLASKAKAVVVLDHHRSAIRKWDDEFSEQGKMVEFRNIGILFDERKSGAMLTWEWLNCPDKKDQPWLAPWLVRLIQDRDLWKWELPESREISAYISSFPMTVEAWDFLHADLETDAGRKVAGEVGAAIVRTNRQHVDSVVKNAVYWSLADGVSVPVLNTTHLHSEVGNALCQGHPFSLTYFDDLKAMVRRWSLRSADGGMDVSKVAEGMQGGGHPRAAGFETNFSLDMGSVLARLQAAYRMVKNSGGE